MKHLGNWHATFINWMRTPQQNTITEKLEAIESAENNSARTLTDINIHWGDG